MNRKTINDDGKEDIVYMQSPFYKEVGGSNKIKILIRHPLNMRYELETKAKYKRLIKEFGKLKDVRGGCWVIHVISNENENIILCN